MNTEILNRWGGQFLNIAWPMLWQSSLLIAMLFALDFALRRKVRAAIRYALWMALLLKLVLPPTMASPTNPHWWIHFASPPPVKAPPISFTVSYGDQIAPTFPLPPPPVILPKAPAMSSAAWALLFSGVGSAGLLAWLLIRWRGVARKRHDVSGAGELDDLLNESVRLAGLRSTVRLKLTEDSMSPAVCGLFRPVILLPQSLVKKLSAEQLRAVLLHEAIHLRRGDVWVNCAQALLQIIYWWHPLLWLANARIRRVREEAVDDAVMLALRDDAEIYAPTLLEVAKFAFRRPLASLGLVGILESRSALQQRIERLMDFHAPRKAGLTIVSILGILAFSAVALPMGEAPVKTNAPAESVSNWPDATNNFEIMLKAYNTNTVPSILSDTNFQSKIHALEQRTEAETLAGPEPVTAGGRQAQQMSANYVLQQTQYTPVAQLDISSAKLATFEIKRAISENDLKKLLLDEGVKIPPTVLIYEDFKNFELLLVRGSKEQTALVFRVVLKLNGTSPKEAEKIANDFIKRWPTSTGLNLASTNLEMRVFKVDTNAFASGLRGVRNLQTNDVVTMAKSLFSQLGVDLSVPGRSIAINDRLGLLFVRATPSELDTVERIVQALNQVPPQIHIKARFIEVPLDEAETALKAGSVVKAGETNTVEILTAEKMKSLLRQLESASGAETLAEPECVTTSGRQTQMRATDIEDIVTNFTSNSTNVVPQIGKVEIGPTIVIIPYVLADGYTINLAAIPQLLEFLGYDKIPVPNQAGQKVSPPTVLPHFRTRQTVADVNLWDNQTLILGNLKDSSFVGGKVVKNGPTSDDRELLVFITATIVDPAGNRVHSDDKLPFNPNTIPPQPKFPSPSR